MCPMSPKLLRPRASGRFTPESLPGLIAWWKFDEEATTTNVAAIDSINGYNLTAISGPMAATGRNGRARRSRVGTNLFNAPAGQAQFTRPLSGSTPVVAQGQSMTFAVWVYPEYSLNSQGTSTTPLFFNFQGTTQANQVRMGAGSIPAYSTPINARVYYTDGTFTYVVAGTAINTAIPQGAWSHLACVISREASTVRIFINGSQVASAALTAGKTPDGIASNCAVSGFSAPGLIDDAVLYGRALSDAEITRLATAPAVPTTNASLHLEAEVWVGRVIGSGGSVSDSTAQAVSDFCTAIDAAGIRDRFYRLNLFCGSNLTAALVPLYRGPSLTGTQLGSATDTNLNFVSGDYVETGSTGGLLGNGSTKCLNTGLAPNALPSVATGHMSYWTGGGAVTVTKVLMGTQDATDRYRFDMRTAAAGGNLGVWGKTASVGNVQSGNTAQDSGAGLFAVTRTGATALTLYKNGATLGESSTITTSVTPAAHGNNWFVFAYNNSGTATDFYQHTLRSYSIGEGLTGSQMSAFYTALNTFMGALSRT